MCTLALFNNDFAVHNAEWLEDIFQQLEQADGMGIAALHRETGKIRYIGAWDMTPHELSNKVADMVESDSYSCYCFHSRQATTAPKKRDDLVQPFVNDDKTFCMGHVGSPHGFDNWSMNGEAISDGRLIFELATRYTDNPIRDLRRADVGPCAGFYTGSPYWVGHGVIHLSYTLPGYIVTSRYLDKLHGYFEARFPEPSYDNWKRGK